MYRVDYFDTEENIWVPFSFHKNEEYAIINMKVLALSGKKTRVLDEGNIIDMTEPATKL